MEKVKELREKVGRIGGFAMLDVGLTVASAAAVARYTNESFIKVLLLLWVVGEGLHYVNDVDTPILRAAGIDQVSWVD